MLLSTDLVLSPDHLRRIRTLYPKAVTTGHARGYRHQMTAELRKMQRRGELVPLWRFAKLDKRAGMIVVPYVRLKELAQVRREKLVRMLALSTGALVFLVGVGWMIWSIRMLLLTAAGTVLGLSVLLWFVSHWRHGCPGLHCSGCGG